MLVLLHGVRVFPSRPGGEVCISLCTTLVRFVVDTGGSVWLATRERGQGGGSVFGVYLPVDCSPAAASPVAGRRPLLPPTPAVGNLTRRFETTRIADPIENHVALAPPTSHPNPVAGVGTRRESHLQLDLECLVVSEEAAVPVLHPTPTKRPPARDHVPISDLLVPNATDTLEKVTVVHHSKSPTSTCSVPKSPISSVLGDDSANGSKVSTDLGLDLARTHGEASLVLIGKRKIALHA